MASMVAAAGKASTEVARQTVNIAAREDVDSGLERLPPEIRRHLLSVLDLASLKALVRASPAFHEQYLLDRRFLLHASLEVTLGSVILDAYAVHRSSDRVSNTPDYLTGLLGTWRGQLEQRSSRRRDGAFTEDEAIHVVAFYFRTIAPMAAYFIRRALNEFERQTSGLEGKPMPQPEPSRTEWQRCLRAAYRFQLLCQVGDPAMPAAVREDAIRNAIFVFLAPEPWEAEELISFYQLAQAAYERVFDDIESEVHPDNPRFDDQDRPPTPEGAFDFCNPWSRRNLVEGTILHGGLGLLQTILLDTTPGDDNKERLVATMQRSIKSSYIPLWGFEGVLGLGRQAGQRQTEPSARDALMANRAPLPFRGEDIDGGPPLAWTVIWGGTYSNLIGAYVSDEMRRWAYVLWDARRLEEHGGRGVLERQWGEFWPHDPRDDLL